MAKNEEVLGERGEGRGEHVWQYVSKRAREQESKRARDAWSDGGRGGSVYGNVLHGNVLCGNVL